MFPAMTFSPGLDHPDEGISLRVRTDCKPRANNRLFLTRWFVVFPWLFFHYSGLTGAEHFLKLREDILHARDRTT